MRTQSLGERVGQITGRTVVADHPVSGRHFHAGGQRPRPGHLHLQRADVAVGHRLERVEIAGQKVLRTPQIPPRS